jgi:PhoH-like ATPase
VDKTTIVLDTSVILHDPACLEKLENSEIILHINVLNELDKSKKYPDEVGRNARVFIKMIDKLFSEVNGMSCEIGTNTITIGTFDSNKPLEKADNSLIECASNLKTTGKTVILMSRDINLRMRARACGITSQSYEKTSSRSSELYTGICSLKNAELGGFLQESGYLSLDDYEELQDLYPNECILFTDDEKNGVALGRRTGSKISLIKDRNLWTIGTRNKEQACAADILLDPNVPLVTLIGNAGTGKTLLTLASALEMVINKKAYKKIIIYRPMQPVGQEVGYLPGNLEEKLDPWMSAIKDNFEFLATANKKDKSCGKSNWKDKLGQYADLIQMEAVTYIRGRSIPNAYIIIDESQNTTREQIKTILTRVGTGSKIVMTGDIYQIDGKNLDTVSNGLTYTAESFKYSDLAGHVTLTKGERSKLATEAALLL